MTGWSQQIILIIFFGREGKHWSKVAFGCSLLWWYNFLCGYSAKYWKSQRRQNNDHCDFNHFGRIWWSKLVVVNGIRSIPRQPVSSQYCILWFQFPSLISFWSVFTTAKGIYPDFYYNMTNDRNIVFITLLAYRNRIYQIYFPEARESMRQKQLSGEHFFGDIIFHLDFRRKTENRKGDKTRIVVILAILDGRCEEN